jgi:hypothetical protein
MVLEHENYRNHDFGIFGMMFLPLVFWRMMGRTTRGITAAAPEPMTSELLNRDPSLTVESPEFRARLESSARDFFRSAKAQQAPWWIRWFSLRTLSDLLINFSSTYPETQKNIFYFTISLGAVENEPSKVVDRMSDYLTGSENRALVRIPSLILVTLARWLRLTTLVGRITLWIVKHVMARRFFIGETLEEAISTIRKLERQGLLLTVDNVGEMALSEADADNYVNGYLRLLETRAVPAISVKLSNLTPHWTGNAWERTKEPVKRRMKQLIEAAATSSAN